MHTPAPLHCHVVIGGSTTGVWNGQGMPYWNGVIVHPEVQHSAPSAVVPNPNKSFTVPISLCVDGGGDGNAPVISVNI